MKSAVAQIRKIQAEIVRQEACRRQIAKLEGQLKEAGEAARTGTDQLILSLARERGIASLAPAQIVAVFDCVRMPTADAADIRPPTSAVALLSDETGEAAVAVRFGNHEGARKAILKEAGLTRNGKVGEWHGRVAPPTLTRLREAFPGKVTVLAIHPSPSTDASAVSIPYAAPAADASDPSARGATETAETAAVTDIESAPPEATPAYREVAVTGTEGSDRVQVALDVGHASTPIPRGPFSALPRRLEPKPGNGNHHEV
jgi:hypothetical protein